MAHKQQLPRWEGTVVARLPTTPASKAWSIYASSFSAAHDLLPAATACRHLHGDHGVPGCKRHVTIPSHHLPTADGEPDAWVTERLVSIDNDGMTLVSSVAENNVGYREFVKTVRVVPWVEGGGGGEGCVLELSYVCDPVNGALTKEALDSFLESGVEGVARSIEVKAAAVE